MPDAGIAADVASTAWYHTIELPGGVATPGWYDLRAARPHVPLPRLDGKRCLDVGSATGYWAFEMERAGAAEVVSLDLEDQGASDWPGAPSEAPDAPQGLAGTGFEIARRHLGSSVRRVDGSVYDLDPAEIGSFDFVFVGSLLLHLSDPIGALRRVHAVCSGELMSLEVVAPLLSLVPLPVAAMTRLGAQQWWIPNRRCHRTMIESAGFDVTSSGGLVRQRFGAGFPRVRLRDARSLWALRVLLVEQRIGVPSQWVLARPR
jgi:tRNA (mo5U34)-methyltransferase